MTSLRSFLRIGLLAGAFLVSGARADTLVCPAPETGIADILALEREVCQNLEIAKSGETCPKCPDLAALQAYTKKSGGMEKCIRGLRDFACTVSPWKDLNVRQRYTKVKALAAEVSTRFPREVFPCIAARESLYLDPVSITCSDRSGKTTQTGLGHIRRATFEDIFGVDQYDAEDPKTPGRIAAKVKQAGWLAPYNCKSPTPQPREIFAGPYQRDPLVQLNAMARVLWNSAYLKSSATDAQVKAGFRKAVRNYNGSPTKEAYADAVLACVSCLQGGGDPLRCLEKASTEKYGKDGKICP